MKFFSSYTNNSINSNYNLSKNEIINLNLSINNYNEIKCVLKYRYIVTEPEVSIYNQHSNLTEGTNDTNIFAKKYIGRLTYYNIILNQSLTKNCENNCALCPTNNLSFCIFCNSNFSLLEDGTKNCSSSNNDDNNNENVNNNDIDITKTIVKKTKEEFAQNMTNLINTIVIGKKYIIQGEDFNLTIKPTDVNIPNSTNVNFSECEKILRDYYKIFPPRIITFFMLELENKNEKSLINNIGYQAYDDNKTILDLSLCNNTNIKIFYLIKSNTTIDFSFISTFKDLNIDILNINDSFFNDICIPYSDPKNDDVVLKDRLNDIYQNYLLCEEGCVYKDTNIETMTISCDCDVKNQFIINETNGQLVNINNIKKSSPFEIIKCYKLVFSLKNKLNNIGFLIFSILIFIYIPLLFFYFYQGITPIKEYLNNEMKEYGYIKENNYSNNKNNKQIKSIKSKKGKKIKKKKKEFPKRFKISSKKNKAYKK